MLKLKMLVNIVVTFWILFHFSTGGFSKSEIISYLTVTGFSLVLFYFCSTLTDDNDRNWFNWFLLITYTIIMFVAPSFKVTGIIDFNDYMNGYVILEATIFISILVKELML